MSTEKIDGESASRPQSAEGVRFVRIATITYTVVLVLANLALMAPRPPRGRNGAGMVIVANLWVMILGGVCTALVERFSRGARLRLYVIAVCVCPFVAYGIDAVIATMWEKASR